MRSPLNKEILSQAFKTIFSPFFLIKIVSPKLPLNPPSRPGGETIRWPEIIEKVIGSRNLVFRTTPFPPRTRPDPPEPFLKEIGFQLTAPQRTVSMEINADLNGKYPMRRLRPFLSHAVELLVHLFVGDDLLRLEDEGGAANDDGAHLGRGLFPGHAGRTKCMPRGSTREDAPALTATRK